MASDYGNTAREKIPNSTLGFSFLLEVNGGGTGANPKTYAIDNAANDFLLGSTDDNAPGVFLFWPSDPGDFPSPLFPAPPNRQYDPGVAPNNIRLSQVPIDALTASFGISIGADASGRRNDGVPSSTNFNNGNFNTANAPGTVLGDFTGLRRITLTLLSPRFTFEADGTVEAPGVLVNGSRRLTPSNPVMDLKLNNLGAVGVVNLDPANVAAVGVYAELNI